MVAHREVTLVLGGARSGKSAVAERLVAEALVAQPQMAVTYVATGSADGDNPDWQRRVAAHRARRPRAWETREVPADGDLWDVLTGASGVALVDSLGTWLAAFDGFSCPTDTLCAALADRAARRFPTVVVSEEVGLGVHPPTEVGRRFADALGELNQAVAAVSGRVLLVVAGRVLELPPSPERSG